MPADKDEFLEIAIEAAWCGGRVVLSSLGSVSEKDIKVKHASDFVTRVDRESEQGIIATIKRRSPVTPFLPRNLGGILGQGSTDGSLTPLMARRTISTDIPPFPSLLR